ncbi:MAG: preprotein translocase subunit YidC [Candidatus Saganbacteria bacterium]|uniref:Preprotein translocase subunit YidC n=1 Tax=Candidatus Saganbacteria bacterium TaxID=2575572 RepID=A0A833L215_UNCSA|nr:MAG: preprotein translocase subunit YidC [Candidatus Saganbacteria bacterium]
MNWLVDIMISSLTFFYSLTNNYGLAIIFLTVTINIALYPLTLSSIVQMSAMQKIQPKIAELQKKLKDTPDQMQKELMELYKKEKVNPFGGCLPTLLKIPFFISLFMALQSEKFGQMIIAKGANANFLWISNLSKPDPFYIMIVLIGITTYFMQKTMPASPESNKMGLNVIMPFFISFISISFPSGVQLYWVVSNLIAIAQQVYILKRKNVSRETF